MVFESDLNFKAHVGFVTKSVFYRLKNPAQVWPFLSLSDTVKTNVHFHSEQPGLLQHSPIRSTQKTDPELCGPTADQDQKESGLLFYLLI